MLAVVSIVKVRNGDVEEAVRSAVKQAGRLDDLIQRDSVVMIKPNVLRPVESGTGLITDVRVTEAVVKMVKELNPLRIIIGEGASVGYDFPDFRDTWDAFKVSGTAEVADRYGTELVDLNRDEPVEVEVQDAYVMGKFRVAKTALEADVVVSLPVLKSHSRTAITCSLKNMKGVLPGLEKRMTHRLGLDRAIVDLNKIVKPHYTIVDAINCMEGTWEYPKDRVTLNLVIAGSDAVAVDTICAKIADVDPAMVLHIRLAQEQGLGVTDLNNIEVKGLKIEEVTRPFKMYSEAFKRRFGMVKLVEKDACTGCMGEIVSTFKYLKEAGYESKLGELVVIMGRLKEFPEVKGTPLTVGKCARKFRDLGFFVPGCPPHGITITDKACEALGIDKEKVHRAIKNLHRVPPNFA